jgi:hypothetical protein
MVGRVHSTSPRVMFASRARDFRVPRSFLVRVLSLWLTLSVAQALDPNKRLTQYPHTAWRATRIRGKLTLRSSSSSGTEIRLMIPGSIIFRKR